MSENRQAALLNALVIVWGVAFLVAAVAALVVWQATGSWHYTAGWGSAGTIAIGGLAIALSTFFNIRTLRRTEENLRLAQQSYARTEQRYRADRIEERNDQVRVAVVKVVSGITAWSSATIPLQRILLEHALRLQHGSAGEAVAAGWTKIMDYELQTMEVVAREAAEVLLAAGFIADGHQAIDVALRQVNEGFSRVVLSPPVTDGAMNSADFYERWSEGLANKRNHMSDLLSNLTKVTRKALPRWQADI